MKRMTTLLGALLLVLCFGASQAVAADGGGAAQTAGQAAPSGQMADGNGSAYQSGASNSAGSIRVLSPGNDGAVTQSNSTTAAAIAANANKTSQSTAQSQTGGAPGSDSTQIAGQEAKNKQDADADAKAVQIAPSNERSSIRVLSPGNGGDVTQSNSATAGAAALNGNSTDQSIDQSQGGGESPASSDARKPDYPSGYGSDYTQVAGQAASNDQDADADATAVQMKPSNSAYVDPRSQPGRRRRRLAVERRDRNRDRGERQQDGPVDRAEPGWRVVRPERRPEARREVRLRLGVHADRRPGRLRTSRTPTRTRRRFS